MKAISPFNIPQEKFADGHKTTLPLKSN